MPLRTVVIVAVVALALPASAAAGVRGDVLKIRTGLVRGLDRGVLERAEAERYLLAVRRCRAARVLLPAPRRRELAGVLHDVSLQAARYTRPRALALFSMLEANTSYLSTHPVPPRETDVIGRDGVLYRAFPRHGLQFHPLGNFARLNRMLTASDERAVARIAAALVARGVRRGAGTAWEYYFSFGGGYPPWTSGMAQAAGAQALARSSRLLERPRLMRQARRAAHQAAQHVIYLRAGPWTRHYSFSSMVVLNSHLQAILSLRKYATLAGDGEVMALTRREMRAAARLLPRFDTGSWSLYSLRGAPAAVKYHVYVVNLLATLYEQTGWAIWKRYSTRFARYAQRRGVATTEARGGEGAAGFQDGMELLEGWGDG